MPISLYKLGRKIPQSLGPPQKRYASGELTKSQGSASGELIKSQGSAGWEHQGEEATKTKFLQVLGIA